MENPVFFQRETRPKEGWWRLASAFYWLVSIVFGLASFAVFSLCYTLVADKLGFVAWPDYDRHYPRGLEMQDACHVLLVTLGGTACGAARDGYPTFKD